MLGGPSCVEQVSLMHPKQHSTRARLIIPHARARLPHVACVDCYSNHNKQHIRVQVKSDGRDKDHNNRNHHMTVQVKGDGRREDGGNTAKTR
jgi:hypothetical protein